MQRPKGEKIMQKHTKKKERKKRNRGKKKNLGLPPKQNFF